MRHVVELELRLNKSKNMKSKLYIPKKLKVGFQKRSDTFTQKLAYVIYWDDKNVLRKEKSWEGWRDKKIDPIEIENIPYGNFTLNKDVHRDGGHFGVGKNHIRVYDDRGIEFEITPENLVFILMNTNCVKRSLEGEYVYAWHGQDLVLLSTNCQDYKASSEFTKLQGEKVGAKNFVPGHWYMAKDQKELMYLGRHDWYEWKREKVGERQRNQHSYYGGAGKEDIYHYFRKPKKKHVFISKDKKIESHSDGNKISRQLTDTVDDDYVGNLELFLGSFNAGAVEKIELEELGVEDPKITIGDITESNGEVPYCYIENKGGFNFSNVKKSGDKYLITPYCLYVKTNRKGYDKLSGPLEIEEVCYIKQREDSKTIKLENGILVCEDYIYYTSQMDIKSDCIMIDYFYGADKESKFPIESLKTKKITRMKVYLSNGRSFFV